MNLTNINDKTWETKTNIFFDLLYLIPHMKLIRNKSKMSSVVPWPNNNNNNKNSSNKDKIHHTNYNKTQQSNANTIIGFSILFCNPHLFRNSKQNVLGCICTMNMYQLQQQQQQQKQEQHGQDESQQYQH